MTYRNGLFTMWKGLREVAACYWQTLATTGYDSMRYAIKHPLVVLFLISVYGYGFYCLINARTERDQYNKRSYMMQQQNDSLELIVEMLDNTHR